MRKCNDEIYQLAKDQALVKKLKNNKRFRTFCLCPPDVMFVTRWSKNSEINRNNLLEYKEKKDQQTGSTLSHLPSLFRENFRHRPLSLERNWKKWNAGQVVPWTTHCSVPAT
jgi:hypothetical protein